MKEKILLFIPGYNCEKQIVRVLNQIDYEVLQYVHEIIMVNNVSTDNTEQKVIEFIEQHSEIPLKLLRNNDNYGLGGSHKTAFNYAIDNNFDYIIVLHGDDQGSVHDLLPVLKNETYKKYDCCLGARFIKGSKLKGYSKTRIFGNIIYNCLFSLVVRKRIYDLGSGLNMYSISMLRSKFYVRFPDNLIFNDCMILASDYYKHNILFCPISWREEDQVSNVKMIGLCVGLLKMALKYLIKKEKFIKSELREEVRMEYKAKVIYEEKQSIKL
ncbi:glycosyltransferase family 2 protein [Clostridium sp.]|uniref:glycosyltransferase family 2 protein n=1 Tax=Clostridium sp. TaxID=1506 RepID=UPI00283E75CC|nr:glycosyltransferase family 2 protein [Clostridium sp.]MDR3598279.1 glycosyltransferase family 2 protein [Clostridium sp.]